MSEFSETITVSTGAVAYEVTVAITPGDNGPYGRPIRIVAEGAHVALPALIVGRVDAECLVDLLRRALMAARKTSTFT